MAHPSELRAIIHTDFLTKYGLFPDYLIVISDQTQAVMMAKGLKRQKKTARKTAEHVSYVVCITAWDRWLSFRVNDGSRWVSGPYDNTSTLTLHGDIFRPEGFKYPRAEITLARRSGMMEEEGHPACIGSVEVRSDLLHAHVLVPAESIVELTMLAVSDRLRIVSKALFAEGHEKCLTRMTSDWGNGALRPHRFREHQLPKFR